MKRTKKNPVVEQFKRDIQGMSSSQITEYARMNSKEREEFLNKFRKEKINQPTDTKDTKNQVPIKIIEPGEVCVMVLNMRGKPIMPTSPGKARMLLKKGKAKVVQRDPFTIQLNYPTGENKQPIILALDPGYKTVGLSAVTNKRELISGEVTLRTDIPERLIEKGMYRRNRRGKNTRYRKPRFEGRDVPKGWLAPSIQHKLDTYVRLVSKFDKILPITSINIETSPFDTQKMQNPEISGIEYQQGTLQGYEVKEYLLEKWGRKCAYGGETEVPLETEHIIPTSRGGSDRVSNLTIACNNCNEDKGNLPAAEFGHL